MSNRTLYVILLATVAGIMSAVFMHNLLTAGKVEVLTPTQDLAPRQSLREPGIFEKRYFPHEQITRADPVTSHDQIRERFAKDLVLKKDQPIFLDDTTATQANGNGNGIIGKPAPASESSAPQSAPAQSARRPMLPPGTVGLSFPAEQTIRDGVKVGDLYDLVLFRGKEGEVEIQQVPQLVKLSVVAVHRFKPSADYSEGQGRVDAVTFALHPAAATRILELMIQPFSKVVPLEHDPARLHPHPKNSPTLPAPAATSPEATRPSLPPP